ncbi:MAG: hypothetical protein AAF291_14710 [Pseudomonadota bacterium]
MILVVVLVAGVFVVLRDDGVLEQVTADNVEQALLDNRVPAPLAACMGPRLADRLTIAQLRALKRAAPEEGERTIPLTTKEVTERFNRIDDREAVEQLALAAGACTFDLMLEGR